MLCRVLLVAIALSYLICVLFLSGIQKEDLDVSLLKKLQHYNVDFDSLGDKKFQEECSNASGKPGPTEIYYIKSTIDVNEVEYKTETTTKSSDSKEVEKEEFNKMLTFWNKYKQFITKKPATTPTTKPTSEVQHEDSLKIRKNGDTKDIGSFDKMLAKYLFVKYTIAEEPDTTTIPTTTDVGLIKILVHKNHLIEEQLASSIAAINKLHENIETLQHTLKERQQKKVVSTLSSPPLMEDNLPEVFTPHNEATNNGERSEQTQNSSHFKLEDLNINKNVINESKTSKQFQTDGHQATPVNEQVQQEVIKAADRNVGNPIPIDIIDKIAESVKNKVLMDLGKNIVTSTATSPTTSATSKSVAPVLAPSDIATTNTNLAGQRPEINKMPMTSENMEKMLAQYLMGLRSNIKNQETNNNRDVITELQYQVPVEKYSSKPLLVPLRNPYAVQRPRPYNVLPLPLQNSMPSPLDVSNFAAQEKQRINPRYSVSTLRKTNLNPITIQTNDDEIKPLTINMNRPINNANIMLTTQTPLLDKKELERWNYMKKYGRNPANEGDLQNVKKTLDSYSNNQPLTTAGLTYLANTKLNINDQEFQKLNSPTVSTEKYYERLRSKNHFDPNLKNDHFYGSAKISKLKNFKNGDSSNLMSSLVSNTNFRPRGVDLSPKLGIKFSGTVASIAGNELSYTPIYPLNFAPKSRFLNQKYKIFNPTNTVKPYFASFNDKSRIDQTDRGSLKENYYKKYLSQYPKSNVVNFSQMQNIRTQNEQRRNSQSEEDERLRARFTENSRSVQDIDTRFVDKNQGFRSYERYEGNWPRSKTFDGNHNYKHQLLTTGNTARKYQYRSSKNDRSNIRFSNPEYLEAALYRMTHEDRFSLDPKRLSISGEISAPVRQYQSINVRGFHDKLEGNDSIEDSLRDCGPDERCLLQVIARQQTPIISAKTGTYDETRFKSFLKTQQKVNEMLEKILATKSDAPSVESI